MPDKRRENRKNRRITLKTPLKVVLCSIGAQVRYELATTNISNNGFFLEFESPGRFPFNESSILEVWLSLDDETVVFFNGKVARIVRRGDLGHGDLGSGIAIRIVQIDRDQEENLLRFIKENAENRRDTPIKTTVAS